jgi:hypothetical protein
MSRAAFRKAERRRCFEPLPTKRQRHALKRLSAEAGIELPIVRWRREASDAIKRLKHYLAQPMLDGWREAEVG